MTNRARITAKVFDLLSDACYEIKECDQCENCPLRHMCLEEAEYSVVEWADLMSDSSWDTFITYADECVPSERLRKGMIENELYDRYRDNQLGF